jgi:kinesin family protein 2/24
MALTASKSASDVRNQTSSPMPQKQPRKGEAASMSGLNAYGLPSPARKLAFDHENSPAKPALLAAPKATSAPIVSPVAALSMANGAERIRVCVRKRPLSSKELNRGEKDIADVLSAKTIVVNEPKCVPLPRRRG